MPKSDSDGVMLAIGFLLGLNAFVLLGGLSMISIAQRMVSAAHWFSFLMETTPLHSNIRINSELLRTIFIPDGAKSLIQASLYTIGSMLTVLSILGIVICIWNIRRLLWLYFILLVLLYIAMLGVCIIGVAQKENLENMIKSKFKLAIIEKYGLDNDTTTIIDTMQTRLKCCGALSIRDFQEAKHWPDHNRALIPQTCCKAWTKNSRYVEYDGVKTYGAVIENCMIKATIGIAHFTSCWYAMVDLFFPTIRNIAIVYMVLLTLEVTALRCCFNLLTELERMNLLWENWYENYGVNMGEDVIIKDESKEQQRLRQMNYFNQEQLINYFNQLDGTKTMELPSLKLLRYLKVENDIEKTKIDLQNNCFPLPESE